MSDLREQDKHTETAVSESQLDAWLKSVLSEETLEDAKEAEGMEEPVFSAAFEANIQTLIRNADAIIAEDKKEKQKEEIKSNLITPKALEERRREKAAKEAAEKEAAAERAEKQRRAEQRMNGKLISLFGKQLRQKTLVNAASVCLILGIGIFGAREAGMFLPKTAGNGAVTETAAAADAAGAAETTADMEMAKEAAIGEAGYGSGEAKARMREMPAEKNTAAQRKKQPAELEEEAPLDEAAPVPMEAEAGIEALPEDGIAPEMASAFGPEAGLETVTDAEGEALKEAEVEPFAAAEPRDGAVAGSSLRTANPVREVSGSDVFLEELGITLSVTAEGKSDICYNIIADTVAEIRYYSENLQSEVTYRAAAEEYGDISGIYYPFDESRTEQITVSLNEADDTEMVDIILRFADAESSSGALLNWTYQNTNYSLWVENGASAEAVWKEVSELVSITNAE